MQFFTLHDIPLLVFNMRHCEDLLGHKAYQALHAEWLITYLPWTWVPSREVSLLVGKTLLGATVRAGQEPRATQGLLARL